MNLTLRDLAFDNTAFGPKGLSITYTLNPNSFRNTGKPLVFFKTYDNGNIVAASYYVSGTVYLLSYSSSISNGQINQTAFNIYTSSLNDPFAIGYSGKDIPVSEIHTDPMILGNKIWIWGSNMWNNSTYTQDTKNLWTASICWTASTSDPSTWGMAGSYRYQSHPINNTYDPNPPATRGQFIFQSGSTLWWVFGQNLEVLFNNPPPPSPNHNYEALLPTKTYTASISNPLKWHVTNVTTSLPYVYFSTIPGHPSSQNGTPYMNRVYGNLFQIDNHLYIFPARTLLSQDWAKKSPWLADYYPQYGYSSSIAYAPMSDMSKWQTASYRRKDELYTDNFIAVGDKFHQIGGYSYVTQSHDGDTVINNAASGTFVISASTPLVRFKNDGLLPNNIGTPQGKGIASSMMMILPYSGTLWAVIYGGYSTDSASNTGSSAPGYHYTQTILNDEIYTAPITMSRGTGQIINFGITPSWKALPNHP